MLYNKRSIIVCMLFLMIFVFGFMIDLHAFAYDRSFSGKIVYVDDKADVFKRITRAVSKHEKSLTLSYPGIESVFKKYRKDNYIDFYDELYFKAGYYAGILSGICIIINDDDTVSFQFNYLTTKKQEKYITKKAKKIAAKYKGESDYYKIKGAHDYITGHTRYDNSYYNPYYVFKKGRGICMSYALAFSRILKEMNIPCIYVKGSDHAWNMVRLDGKWYGVDVTWDDANGNYRYFLKGTKDFHGHKMKGSRCIKKLKRAKYSYNNN